MQNMQSMQNMNKCKICKICNICNICKKCKICKDVQNMQNMQNMQIFKICKMFKIRRICRIYAEYKGSPFQTLHFISLFRVSWGKLQSSGGKKRENIKWQNQRYRQLIYPGTFTFSKGDGTFHSAGQSEEGNFVLALANIQFSWNFYQIIPGTKYEYKTSFGPITCHLWQDNGKKEDLVMGLFFTFGSTVHDWGWPKNGQFWTKTGQTWQACQRSKVVQKGPKWSTKVLLTISDHFG